MYLTYTLCTTVTPLYLTCLTVVASEHCFSRVLRVRVVLPPEWCHISSLKITVQIKTPLTNRRRSVFSVVSCYLVCHFTRGYSLMRTDDITLDLRQMSRYKVTRHTKYIRTTATNVTDPKRITSLLPRTHACASGASGFQGITNSPKVRLSYVALR